MIKTKPKCRRPRRKMSSPESSAAFSIKLSHALERAEADFVEAASAGKKIRFSIASFTRNYQISRSALYESYPEKVKLITALIDRLSTKPAVAETQQYTVQSLQAELNAERRRSKKREADLLSQQLSDLLTEERCGPAFRDRTQLLLENQEFRRRLADLEQIIKNQRGVIQSLMAQLNEGGS